MSKYLRVLVLLTLPLLAQQQHTFHWPVIKDAGSNVNNNLINSNFGDYRESITPRFHMGIDIQDDPNNREQSYIRPIARGRVCVSAVSPTYGYRWYLLEHGNWNESQCNPNNLHSAYLHLVDGSQTIYEERDSVETTDILSDGWEMHLGHLHLNVVTNYDDINANWDDVGINPFSDQITWQEIDNGEVRPHDNTAASTNPYIHALYFAENGLTISDLGYPTTTNIETNFQLDYVAVNFHGGSEWDQTITWDDAEYETHHLLIQNISSENRLLQMYLHATDYWNTSGMTPNMIQVWVDQFASSTPTFSMPYYQLHFQEINLINNDQPHANIVYNLDGALTTARHNENYVWYRQFYRLFGNNNNLNGNVLPDQNLNDPIDIHVGPYSEEGMHRIEIIVRSDRYYDNTQNVYTQSEKKGICYFYLLKNSDSYMDLAQSGTYN